MQPDSNMQPMLILCVAIFVISFFIILFRWVFVDLKPVQPEIQSSLFDYDAWTHYLNHQSSIVTLPEYKLRRSSTIFSQTLPPGYQFDFDTISSYSRDASSTQMSNAQNADISTSRFTAHGISIIPMAHTNTQGRVYEPPTYDVAIQVNHK